MKFIKKPVVIEASQWFKNGDHPNVRPYYSSFHSSSIAFCEQCGFHHNVHGWVNTLEQGHRVCPGDWIITGVKGERYPCKPDIFEKTYELVEESFS